LFVVMQAIVPAILADRIVCLTPLSAVAGERNAFSETKALAPVSAFTRSGSFWRSCGRQALFAFCVGQRALFATQPDT
jgi:hypothetical protein